MKFDDRLSSEVTESSRRSNHIEDSEDMINKLVEAHHFFFTSS